MNNPLEYFLHWEKTFPLDLLLRQPQGGEWKTWTYRQAGEEIRSIANHLRSLALPPNSHIAILSKNCAHWIMADLAIMMSGHVSVPLYPTLPADSLRQILIHSEARVIFIGKLDNFDSQREGVPEISRIYFGAYGIQEGDTWEQIVAATPRIEKVDTLNPDDLMTIVYTSGTTGNPKGVMHAFKSFDATLKAARAAVKFPDRPRLFSYLPLSHIAERIGIETMGLLLGAQFSFSESLESFPKNLAATRPHYFFAVPRIWAKFQEKILEKIPESKLNKLISIPLLGGIIKRSIRKKLGLNQSKLFFSGAAPLGVGLLEWWQKLGITIYEVYGMTEDCVYAHFNSESGYKFGTVGKPLPGLQVKLGANDEICVKSDYLMRGYYKEPELTASMFDEDGFLKTGDTGSIDSEGYLTIVGRVKDQFKTDKGKYISPAPIEMKLLENKDIGQVCVVGMGIPQPIMLTVLSDAAKSKTKSEIAKSLSDTIESINLHLETYERLEHAVIMQQDWTQENGLLTPTLKLKRNALEKIYVPKYRTWFQEKERVVWE
ncbi:MAG: AMP-binding protein [Cytophagales bacterium]|nr:AMP-binding protein [Cytophagales bacterium]